MIAMPCGVCGGSGRDRQHRLHVIGDDAAAIGGHCFFCGGSGNAPCEECGMELAVTKRNRTRGTMLLCYACAAEFDTEEWP